MNINKTKRKKIIYIILTAALFYIILRASGDIPEHVEYWKIKSLRFLITDFVSVLGIVFFIDYIINKLIYINITIKKSVFLEYGIIIIFGIAICLAFAFFRGIILHGKMYPIEKLTVPIIITPLFIGISYSFKKYKIENEKRQLLLAQQAELKQEKLTTELQSLRAQYHPHFLFNALNTIYFLIDSHNQQARQAVELLSEILRYQVKCGGDKVLLQDEIEYMQKDIEMRKLRSSQLLELNVNIDNIVKEERIYPLLFTPLIENAFKYVGGDYIIDISLQIINSTITLYVSNSLPSGYQDNKKDDGTGLINLRKRLSILYPKKYSLECSNNNENFRAILKIDLL